MNFKNEKGAALSEYGIVVGLVAVVAIGAVLGVGERVESVFSEASIAVALDDTDGNDVAGGGFANALAPDIPENCQLIPAGSGEVYADIDYPGTFCFEFPDNTVTSRDSSGGGDDGGSIQEEDWLYADTSDAYTFISGTNGMLVESGSGDDVAFYNLGSCITNSSNLGDGSNEVVFLNQQSDDAYFRNFFGTLNIAFTDGSDLRLNGNVSSVHFSDVTLNATEISERVASDGPAPDAGCA